MGSLRRMLSRVLVATTLAVGAVCAGLGAQAGQAIPPAGGLLRVSPGYGAPGWAVEIRGSSFACARVDISWSYSNGELAIVRHVGTVFPQAGDFTYAARVPADAAQGWSTIAATGPSHLGCTGSVAFYICTTCLGDALPAKGAGA